MKNHQSLFFDLLLHKSGGKKNLVSTMTDQLALSGDSSYRRISGKIHITLNEGISLATHYGISLDSLTHTYPDNKIIHKVQDIYTTEDLEDYFDSTIENLKKLKEDPNAEFIYAAKDIPLFYLMKFETIRKFKIYTWMNLMDTDYFLQKISFEKFAIPEKIKQKARSLFRSYRDINATEIWSTATLHTLLGQIAYFLQLEMLNTESVLKICDEIILMLDFIHEKTTKKIKNTSNFKLQLYQNDLLIMNNMVFIKFLDHKMLFVPYTILSYYYTIDESICHPFEKSMNLQIKNSELLSGNQKAKKVFFNAMYKSVEALRKLTKKLD
ncbi:hypothetical protein VUJ46_12420 [Chryseobacterium sp. MYb264]|uniref:hypothetical protein n=1 Tax=Chryseobacterium sp. MYb264 TaxID=2745153 RepID=UPI002E12A0EE|nr:hypothetical protein VUJ46_12420 [Chryseobacterium sp. MYb264]